MFVDLVSCGLQEWKLVYLEREQHGEELELVPEQHGVAEDWHLGLQGVLDGHRRDVLSTGRDDQLCVKEKASNFTIKHSDPCYSSLNDALCCFPAFDVHIISSCEVTSLNFNHKLNYK